MTNEQALFTVIQGGSFAVLVVIIVWVGRVFVPSALAAFERQGERFEKMQERAETRHAAELAKRDERDEKLTNVVQQLATGQEKLTDRIEQLEERTGEHRPLRP